MHVAVIQRAALRNCRKRRHAIESDIHFAGGAAKLEILDAIVKRLGQIGLVHALEERAFDIHRRYDKARRYFLAALERNARGTAILYHDLVDAGFRAQFATVHLERASN